MSTLDATVSAYRAHLAAYGHARAFREGMEWYPRALLECRSMAQDSGYSVQRCAAIVAILSPRARWRQNVRAARLLLGDAASIRVGDRRRYRARYGVLPANVKRARLAVDARRYSVLVSGPKVSAFYRNIMCDADIVTVDTIMSKAADLGSDVTPSVRATIVAAVNVLADEYGLSPRDMQAAVWCAYRGGAD